MTIMGKVAYSVVVAFIASILTLLAVNWLAPDDDKGPGSAVVQLSPTPTLIATPDDVTQGDGPSPSPSAPPDTGSPVPAATPTPDAAAGITLAQVATHDSASSCWIVVNGTVYDVTSYLPQHPADYDVLLTWCGKEATQAYADKGGEGDDHSARADALLDRYEIGPLAP
jgi:hypothetical protein